MGMRTKTSGLLAALVLCSQGAVAGDLLSGLSSSAPKRQATQEYVLENLDLLVREIEEHRGVTFYERPNVEFGVSKHCGFPPACMSEYDESNNTIYINTTSDTVTYTLALPGEEGVSLKGIVKHELGHFYLDMIAERHLGMSWPIRDSRGHLKGGNPYLFLAEGLAHLFAGEPPPWKDDVPMDWPGTPKDMDALGDTLHEFRYLKETVAPNVFEPILQQGERGVLEILTNPPDGLLPIEFLEYRNRILERLDGATRPAEN